MRDVVICEPMRTPVGRYGGVFKEVSAAELGVTVLRAILDRTDLDPALIEDVVVGQCNANGEAPAIGRVIALDAGLPFSVCGSQVDRRCGSGLQAVINAVAAVQTGAQDLVVAGGAESMSNAGFYSTDVRWGAWRTGAQLHDGLVRARQTAGGKNHFLPQGMLWTAENLRNQYGISREEQDLLAAESHRRAVAAQANGTFAEEIVPVTVRAKGGPVVVDQDEHPRATSTPDVLAKLRPILSDTDPDATVTAGNSSGQNDAAALCIVTTAERAAELGLRPLVRLVAWAVAGVGPDVMGIGPVPAAKKALDTAGLTWADIDLVELNEAFAAQVIAVYREWGFGATDLERTNVHGSGISLGHPVGATGARMLGVLARELARREQTYGLETMCIGGGQGLAAIWQRISG